MTNELLTTKELAERLRLTIDTVRRWRREGRIPALTLAPNTVRYEWDAVLDVLRREARRSASRKRRQRKGGGR